MGREGGRLVSMCTRSYFVIGKRWAFELGTRGSIWNMQSLTDLSKDVLHHGVGQLLEIFDHEAANMIQSRVGRHGRLVNL